MEYLFGICIFLIVYPLFLYPLILKSLSGAFEKRKNKQSVKEESLPRVSIVVSCYNEEETIGRKINNCMELDYPGDRLEFLFGSDGSDDGTVQALNDSRLPNLKVFEYERSGKAHVLNRLLKEVRGDIVVFSDANTIFSPDALKRLVSGFHNRKTGIVYGKLELLDGKGRKTESLYWKYELLLRRLEERLGVTVGINGGIYAIRREAFRPLPERIINDDFYIFLSAVLAGYEAFYDEECAAYENSPVSAAEEMQRRVRISKGNIQTTFHLMPSLFVHMLRRPLWGLGFISHKALRWLMPFSLIGAFVSNSVLASSPPYSILFFSQLAFYLLAGAGIVFKKSLGFPVRQIGFFVRMNYGIMLGLLSFFIFGVSSPAWKSSKKVY